MSILANNVFFQFPPFSINEVGRFLQAGRREIGHGTQFCYSLFYIVHLVLFIVNAVISGALAEKAFLPLLPAQFPFTIRVTSQVLDSNGTPSLSLPLTHTHTHTHTIPDFVFRVCVCLLQAHHPWQLSVLPALLCMMQVYLQQKLCEASCMLQDDQRD